MNKPTVILLSAKARCGKDQTASFIKEQLEDKEKKVLVTHYADLLKYICKTFFCWDGVKDDNGRTILQKVGTDVIRKQNPDYWVNFIISIIKLFPNEWDYILIPDCRFPNEIENIIKNFNTITVRIERPNFDNGLTEEQKNHESETSLDNFGFDFIIDNSDTLEYLHESVKTLVDYIVKNNEEE